MTLDEPHLVGIVNATPDSFSDGGVYPSREAIVGHALRLVEEGAAMVDIGGESTRPGAERVPIAEQIDRVVPVIEELRECTDVAMSIDTTHAAVAEAALDAGATVINDVSAGREDDAMFALAARRECGLVLMHRRVGPEQDSYSDQYEREPEYDDVVDEVRAFLLERCAAARAAVPYGVRNDSIVIDPGLGFGKSVAQNYELIRRTAELVRTGYPVLGAASRKSFVGHVTGVDEPRARAVGSTAVSVLQYLAGVRLFRVHDVAAHREALAVARAISAGERAWAGAGAGP
ncbi:MAG: dihydropteroate synthase [Planctomycetes bacterium]|nr:dihydropteroate synthase [Planctomycetota bacterium]